ncbi:MAG: hypothetical protein PHQ93_03505 [Sulfurimonas sp.]|uniref:hypothetical protein n=1 Tax=Sulfurimonas sp. TaxID=2022749 RepID=UPI002633D4B1|nr:hypothetical protein [Sulfurimonas sp.]MDD5400239.1 hypothetical protein [Sulfurimonas sp.]
MHSLTLKVDDGFYAQLLSFLKQNKQQVDIVEDIKDDGYPAISTDEARMRVAAAVDRYKNGGGTYLNQEEYNSHINNSIEKLKAKYANN